MKGNKYILVAILLVVIFAAGAFLYFRTPKKDYLPAALAVPDNALIIYQGKNLNEQLIAFRQNVLFQKINNHEDIDTVFSKYHELDSIIGIDPVFKKILVTSPLITCVESSGARQFDLLYLIQCNGSINGTDMLKFIQAHFPDFKNMKRNVNGNIVYDIQNRENKPQFTFGFLKGILCVSRNAVLVEDAITAYTDHKFRNNTLTDLLIKNQDKEKLFLNFHSISKLLGAYSNVNNHIAVSFLDSIAEAGVYDIQWKIGNEKAQANQDVVTFQGDVLNTSDRNYLQIFLNQQAQKISLPNVISSGTSVFMEWGANSVLEYFENYQKYLKANSNSTLLDSYMVKLRDENNIDLKADLLLLFGNDWGYAVKEPLSADKGLTESFYIRVADTIDIIDKVSKLSYNANKFSTYKAVKYRGYAIEKWFIDGFIPIIFGNKLLESFQAPVFTRVGNYLVFANSENNIQRIIDDYLDNQTLSSDRNWQLFEENLASSSNFFLYIDPSRSIVLGEKFTRRDFSIPYYKNVPYYKSIGAVGFQIVSNPKSFYNLIAIQRTKGRQGGTEMLWSQSLEGNALTKPFVFDENGSSIILIQDEKLNLYKFSSTGNLVWKIKLESAIIGDLYPVSFYGGNSTQYLFSTKSNIHLINSNGGEAGAYPIRLSAPASTGVALLNVSDNNQLTYYICTENAKVYGFSLNGQPIIGWSPLNIEAKSELPIKYFSTGGQNYLFTVTTNGQLYIWTTKGKVKIKPIESNAKFENPFKIRFGSTFNSNVLFSVDTSGTLFEIQLDGNIRKNKFSLIFHHPFFDYIDTDGNGKSEYVVSGNNMIASYDHTTKSNWQIKVSSPLYFPPQFVNSGEEIWVGYAAAPENMIYLRSRAGTLFQGFPIRGNRDFAITDINKNGGVELITTGNDKKLYLYRIGK